MNKYPKFSILMSVYIKENPNFLDECLNSINIQTLKATEIVLVHDGNLTPSLYEVINKWTNNLPIKNVELENNVGLGKALNIGLSNCKYNYIIRCDTDDINIKTRFEKQIGFMYKHPEIDVLGSYIEEFNLEPGDIKKIKQVPVDFKKIKKKIKIRNPINHMAVTFKKDAVIKSGGYKHLMFMEDYYLWIRMVANGAQIYNLNEILVFARIGNGIIKRRHGYKYLKSEIKLFKLLIKYKLTNKLYGLFILSLRSTCRIMPTFILKKIYTGIRKHTIYE